MAYLVHVIKTENLGFGEAPRDKWPLICQKQLGGVDIEGKTEVSEQVGSSVLLSVHESCRVLSLAVFHLSTSSVQRELL